MSGLALQRKWGLTALGLISVWMLLLLTGVSEKRWGLELAQIQLIVFPFILFFFASISFCKISPPKVIIVLAALGGAMALGYSYLHMRDSAQTFLVAHLNADEFEIGSRHLRENLNRKLKELDLDDDFVATRYHGSFTSQREVEKLLEETEKLPAIVWGSSRWVNISFHSTRAAIVTEEDLAPWLNLVGLKFVSSVPVVGLSFEPQRETAEYLAALISAHVKGVSSEKVLSASFLAQKELAFRDLTMRRSPWSTFAHHAYAWWMLGNIQMAQAFADGKYSPGYMRCAIESYTHARKSLRDADNPDLLAAALNNRAIAHAIMLVLEGKRELRPLIRKELLAATKTTKQKDLFGVRYRAAKIARLNLKLLSQKKKTRKLARRAQSGLHSEKVKPHHKKKKRKFKNDGRHYD